MRMNAADQIENRDISKRSRKRQLFTLFVINKKKHPFILRG